MKHTKHVAALAVSLALGGAHAAALDDDVDGDGTNGSSFLGASLLSGTIINGFTGVTVSSTDATPNTFFVSFGNSGTKDRFTAGAFTGFDQVNSTDTTKYSFGSTVTGFYGQWNLSPYGEDDASSVAPLIFTVYNGANQKLDQFSIYQKGPGVGTLGKTFGAGYVNTAGFSYFTVAMSPGDSAETYSVSGFQSVAAPVPEPETYAMMIAGLGAVGFMARRRKSQG